MHKIKDIALGEEGADPDACAGPAPNALDELVGAGLEVPWPEQDLAQSAQDFEQPEEAEPEAVDSAEAQHVQPLTIADVRGVDYGYGEGGCSVQKTCMQSI